MKRKKIAHCGNKVFGLYFYDYDVRVLVRYRDDDMALDMSPVMHTVQPIRWKKKPRIKIWAAEPDNDEFGGTRQRWRPRWLGGID